MSSKEKAAWCGYALILVFLFLLSSTNLILKEKEQEIYPVSVIIDDVNDEYYANFRTGMDMAAENYHVDVNFITLYADNDQEQQLELLRREVRDGARAVVLAPVNENSVVMALEELPSGCPIVLLGSSTGNSSVACSISPDMQALGKQLAGQIVLKENPQVPVCLLTEGLVYSGNRELYDGLSSVLEEHGFSIRLVQKADEDTYRRVIEETVYPESSRILLVAMDPEALHDAADIISGSSVYREHVEALYGVGSTVAILNRLDEGVIDGLITYNQFDEGYLGIERAVEAIQGTAPGRREEMEAYYIEAEDLQEGTYEKLLYPMQ